MDEYATLALGDERVRNAELAREAKAGGALRAGSRPTVNGRAESTRLHGHSH